MSCGIEIDRANIRDTRRLRFTVTKDGAVWDLSGGGASVTLTFAPPDNVDTFTRTMTAESASTGIFYYDTTASDLTVAGDWKLAVTATDGTVTLTYTDEINWEVVDQPSGAGS